MERYKLHKVNSPPPMFNLTIFQEFYANVSSKFPGFGGEMYVWRVLVPFDASFICLVLSLEPFSVSDMSSFNLLICQYDKNTYHREAYIDPFIPLSKGQASKSRLKPFYKSWSDFLCRNILGSLNNGNPTLESARILYAMLTLFDVPFGYLIFKPIFSKTNSHGKQQRGSTIHSCLITLMCQRIGVPTGHGDMSLRSTKDLSKCLMNLSDVMCAIAHGEPCPHPPSNISQERKIAFLEC